MNEKFTIRKEKMGSLIIGIILRNDGYSQILFR